MWVPHDQSRNRSGGEPFNGPEAAITSGPMLRRVAVLVSGRGSNLRALVEYLAAQDAVSAAVVLVVSDRPQAGALTLARELGVHAAVLDRPGAADGPLLETLHKHDIGIVVLAGYVKLLPAAVVRAFRGRVVNVHPALLPAFGGHGMYGARVHRAVLASGARVSGATVHFVDEVYDRGAIIAQWPVPVFAEDTEESLAERVLRVEHALLPPVVRAVASGRIMLDADNRVRGVFEGGTPGATFTLTPGEHESIVHAIENLLAR